MRALDHGERKLTELDFTRLKKFTAAGALRSSPGRALPCPASSRPHATVFMSSPHQRPVMSRLGFGLMAGRSTGPP